MINFGTNTILLITMFVHYTIFTRIVVAQHVFSFLTTTTDIHIVILSDTCITKHLILPINAGTITVLVSNTPIGTSIKITRINISTKNIREVIFIATKQLEFILILYVIFNSH